MEIWKSNPDSTVFISQDLRFLSTEDKKSRGEKRENELLIQRRKEAGHAGNAGGGGGMTVPYRVIDNPAKLTNADWDRVVAVFVMGQVCGSLIEDNLVMLSTTAGSCSSTIKQQQDETSRNHIY